MSQTELVAETPETDYVPMPYGTYEEGLTWVGKKTEPERTRLPIELGMIRDFAGLVEDRNPCYWDPEVSKEIWGAQIAPAGLLRCMFCPPRWAPDTNRVAPIASQVPLPGRTLINVESSQTFLRPLRYGDYITIVEEIAEISPEKTTRLGRGHFVLTKTTYTDDSGEVIATGYGRLLRFTPSGAEEAK